jgi:hypothetical protein
MKKIILLLIATFSICNLYSQINYFNKYINTQTVAKYIYPENNGYVCASWKCDSNFVLLSKLDSLGNQFFSKNFKEDSSMFNLGGFIKCKTGGYFLAANIVRYYYGNTNSIYDYLTCKQLLIRLDNNFDTIWTKLIYNDTIVSTISNCFETSNKEFVLCGEKNVANYKNNVSFIKVDSLGNKLWDKVYDLWGYMGDNYDNALNISETPDKGFLFGCSTTSSPCVSGFYTSGDGIVVKTDSMGIVQWIKNLGGNEMDSYATTVVCNDSNYLLATVYSYATLVPNEWWSGKLRLMKVTPQGIVLWDKQYEPETVELDVRKVIELANGDYVVGGTKTHHTSEYKSYNDSYLFKLNSKGERIWYREFALSTDTIQLTFNNLYNLEQTPDGGFVCCGEYFVNTVVQRSTWVFKTDSLGCLQPGCQYVGIEKLDRFLPELLVFPNPTTSNVTVTLPLLNKQGQLQVYNMLGQKVYEVLINKNVSQIFLDAKKYEKGLYKLILKEQGEIRGQSSLIITN